MRDILDEYAADQRRRPSYPDVAVEMGLVVEDRASGFCGDVVRWNAEGVTLRDRAERLRHFGWKPGGFLIEGRPVTLIRPTVAAANAHRVTASGSIAGEGRARTARASRIWVEGKHDAELVEHVWGDDLRELGIVVEPMHGADDLAALVAEFAPGPQRRLGVLLDHLVAGSKETRIAQTVRDPNVLVTGHPFVDVWAGIRPKVLGLDDWPDIPKGDVPWKEGLCAALGVPFDGFWPRLRNRVQTFADLRPELVGAVERLIDFVSRIVRMSVRGSTPAEHAHANRSDQTKAPAKTRLTIVITLIRMFIAGPEVSLNGSPTVSPTTAALCASQPLPPCAPASMYFLALSQAPPGVGHEDGEREPGDQRAGEEPAERIDADEADDQRHDDGERAGHDHLAAATPRWRSSTQRAESGTHARHAFAQARDLAELAADLLDHLAARHGRPRRSSARRTGTAASRRGTGR